MVKGAMSAPTEAPLLKMAVANARSFLGKYSAVTLMAAGKLPASPSARMQRAPKNSHTLVVEIARAASATPDSLNVRSTSLAPSKPTAHSPATIPQVAIPQNAWSTAPVDHTKIAQR